MIARSVLAVVTGLTLSVVWAKSEMPKWVEPEVLGEDGVKPTWERPKTTRRYLQGPYCERLVTYWREGKIVIGENVHQDDWRLHYSHLPAWGAWLVHGDGTALDFRTAELNVTTDGAPDHAQTWHEDGLDVTLAACVPFGRRPATFARITFANRTDKPLERTYAVLLRCGFEYEMTYGTPDIYSFYNPSVDDWLRMSTRRWWKERHANLFCTGDYIVDFEAKDVAFDWDPALGAARFTVTLKPGETKTVDFTLATGKLPDETYDTARAAMRASWKAELRNLVLPPYARNDKSYRPLVYNLAAQMLQMLAMPTQGDFVIPRQGGQQRLTWPGEAMDLFAALDKLGLGQHVDRAVDFLFERCVQASGEAGPFRNRWACDTACVLRILAQHCLLTENAALWRKHAEKAAKAFAWVQAKREADGLFPPMKSTDSTEAPMKHWGQTDVQNYVGLDWYARATAHFAEPNAAAAKAAADDYRAAIEKVLVRWRKEAEGKDEFFLPISADGSREDYLVKHGFFYLHPSAFAELGFLSADELVRVRKWLVNHDFANDRGLYMRHPSSVKGQGRHVWYTTLCEQRWVTAWARVGQDELARQALEAMIRYSTTDEYYVGERYHDADPWYFPWSPNASGSARIILSLFDCPPPPKRKIVIAEGWDIMNARLADVYAHRQQFAATGVDGIDFHLWGRWNGGPLERVDAKDDRSLREADLSDAARMLPVLTATPGLTESVLRVGLTMKKRIAWTDDARWERLADNIAFLADFARTGGIKGFAIDEEDYEKTKQFFVTDDDPPLPELAEIVRARGRQFFGAMLREFPDARINCSWLFSTILKWHAWAVPSRNDDQNGLVAAYGELWPYFLNGFIDVMPPETVIVEGNEQRGYRGMAVSNAFEIAAWETSRGIASQVAPENRRKFLGQLSVSFGSYLDMYVNPPGEYYLPPLYGRREARFHDNLTRMLTVADDFVWLYGEKGQWIDWGIDPKTNKDYLGSKAYSYPTWEKQIPGFARTLRIAKGDLSVLDEEVASGVFSNLLGNAGCDGAKAPTGLGTWTKFKEPPADLFTTDQTDGAAAPGCVRLNGSGCYVYRATNLKPGDEFYIRVAVKGGNPQLETSWQKDGKYIDSHGGQKVPLPARWPHDRWYMHRLHYVVPEGANGMAITFGGSATPEKPNAFDDIGIFKKVR